MASTLVLERHEEQTKVWPASGKHVLAQFDDETIVVYQAYKPEIGRLAARRGEFGEGFSRSRMTWLKPNFLWMMYRSGWGTKENQEVTLALRLRRAGFDALIAQGVLSSFQRGLHEEEAAWRRDLDASSVRVQWDPDHGPRGAPLERRAIQIGVGGRALERMLGEWIASIEDVSDLVAAQRSKPPSELLTPRERVYPVAPSTAKRLGM